MSNPIYYKRISGSSIQGDAYTVIEPSGTLVIANGGELRLHDGSVAGGNPVGGGGGVGSFGTDKGIGADYASNNPAILFSDDDMIIRTGGTAGHGTVGAMYIASAEELVIGHADNPLTDLTSLGSNNYTNYLQIDTNGIEMTTARGTVQFGYNLEAPGVPTHFHINKLNQSFDLFFGDDSNYFHLPAGAGSPVIGANDTNSGQKLWTFGQDGSLALPQSNSGAAVISAGTVGLEFTSNGHAFQFNTDGTLIFPDLTVQTTAFELRGLPPSSAWGTTYPAGPGVTNMDYQFFFDGGIGYPTMQSYASAGGNPLYNSIWSIESYVNGTTGNDRSGPVPVQVNNTGGVGIFAGALSPGDYVIVRIQNLDTGRIYRATFMGSYFGPDVGNEVKYGSITVERLL